MSEQNIFEQACKLKVRFETNKGSISVEDLYDLPLNSQRGHADLDSIAVGLYKQIQTGDGVTSFTGASKPTATQKLNQLKFDIVRKVIETRLEEAKRASEALANKVQREKIMELIKQKQDGALSAKSVEELEAELNKLS